MLPFLLLAALVQGTGPIPPDHRASSLYDQCRANIKVQDGSVDSVTQEDISLSDECMSYVDGFTSGYAFVAPTQQLICLNETTTMGTLSRVFVAYMTGHPSQLDGEKSIALANALLKSYPCPKARKR